MDYILPIEPIKSNRQLDWSTNWSIQPIDQLIEWSIYMYNLDQPVTVYQIIDQIEHLED